MQTPLGKSNNVDIGDITASSMFEKQFVKSFTIDVCAVGGSS
jgi:hypothetical protein